MDFGFELELDQTIAPGGIAPGASGQAQISLWAIDDMPTLRTGQAFQVREGARVIGRGTITEVEQCIAG
jgi:hypothetical protein